MNAVGSFERCLSFINCHLQAPKTPFESQDNETGFRAVTISRQAGAGGHTLAERLARQLSDLDSDHCAPWAIFDRNLVERALQDHNLPARLSRFMPEDRVSQISDTMDELFGLHPPSWLLVRQTSETILQLAELGRVIVIGRGANIVTRRLPNVFHVRLVGSLEKRIERLPQPGGLTRKAMIRVVNQQDRARQRYVRQFFGKDIDDPLQYHLVANTDLLSIDTVARMIVNIIALNAKSLAA